jgi:hypothetical protein
MWLRSHPFVVIVAAVVLALAAFAAAVAAAAGTCWLIAGLRSAASLHL